MSSQTTEETAGPTREDLVDETRADPGLTPAERETTIGFAVDEAEARIHTEEASLIRRLLSHGDVRIDALGIFDGDRRHTRTLGEVLAEDGPDGSVVRLKGRLPVRYLTVGSVGRSHDEHAPVVSEGVFDE